MKKIISLLLVVCFSFTCLFPTVLVLPHNGQI